jgi:hypothetical protein
LSFSLYEAFILADLRPNPFVMGIRRLNKLSFPKLKDLIGLVFLKPTGIIALIGLTPFEEEPISTLSRTAEGPAI